MKKWTLISPIVKYHVPNFYLVHFSDSSALKESEKSAGWIMVATKPVEHLGKETVRRRRRAASSPSLTPLVPEAAEAAAANESNFI